MEEVYAFLKEAGVYYLATAENGSPRVRPFGTVNVYDGKLYIQTGRKKAVAAQIYANPEAEICAFKDGRWIRVHGILKEDGRREARKSMLDAYPELRSMYDEDDGNTLVFYFEKAEATIFSFVEAPKTVRF